MPITNYGQSSDTNAHVITFQGVIGTPYFGEIFKYNLESEFGKYPAT